MNEQIGIQRRIRGQHIIVLGALLRLETVRQRGTDVGARI
jgi:hypothetical protein